jgi:hypothetical protein
MIYNPHEDFANGNEITTKLPPSSPFLALMFPPIMSVNLLDSESPKVVYVMVALVLPPICFLSNCKYPFPIIEHNINN